jgi:RNA polymerase sigma-70 factor, ECF subfamily
MTVAVTDHESPHHSGSDVARAEYAALVREAAAGTAGAMERLLMRAQEVAYRFSLLVCGHPEDAEDVMQDALLNTYRHVSQIKDPEAFRTWLYQTVRNACLMKRRRRVDEPATMTSLEQGSTNTDGEPSAIDLPDVGSRSADQQLMDSWVGERLRRALAKLPPGYRVIVVLREMEGLSTREVAAVTGFSEANVKQRLHRARMMLRESLEDLRQTRSARNVRRYLEVSRPTSMENSSRPSAMRSSATARPARGARHWWRACVKPSASVGAPRSRRFRTQSARRLRRASASC